MKGLRFKTLPVYKWEDEGYIALYQVSKKKKMIYMLDFNRTKQIQKDWGFLLSTHPQEKEEEVGG